MMRLKEIAIGCTLVLTLSLHAVAVHADSDDDDDPPPPPALLVSPQPTPGWPAALPSPALTPGTVSIRVSLPARHIGEPGMTAPLHPALTFRRRLPRPVAARWRLVRPAPYLPATL
jgi:hypothetical protein